jgi:malate dehydrogenase (oxaloacetate-decarboxylating)
MPSKKMRGVSLEKHAFYGGKTEMSLKAPVSCAKDFSVWYTPGVGEVVEAVMKDGGRSFELTSRANTVAIISDGTRVLGYGNAGPRAALSVMEGKAMLFKYLGGVDAVPLCINAAGPEDIVKFALACEPTFGGINLEDISSPACFGVLDTLRAKSKIPVWHDDAQGTATVILTGLMNALEFTGRSLKDSKITLVGAGAANARTAMLLMAAGVPGRNIVLVDKSGVLGPSRKDLRKIPLLWKLCRLTNAAGITGGIAEAMRGADAVVAAAACGPGVIKPQWVADMAENPVVFSLANPVPEILPDVAKKAGAAVVATGRGDFPNQVNNCLVFPPLFRGVLDSRASTITDSMCVAAASALAGYAREKGLRADRIVPTMDDTDAFVRCAAKTASAAVKEGVAAVKKPEGWFYNRAEKLINRAQRETSVKLKSGVIAK